MSVARALTDALKHSGSPGQQWEPDEVTKGFLRQFEQRGITGQVVPPTHQEAADEHHRRVMQWIRDENAATAEAKRKLENPDPEPEPEQSVVEVLRSAIAAQTYNGVVPPNGLAVLRDAMAGLVDAGSSVKINGEAVGGRMDQSG